MSATVGLRSREEHELWRAAYVAALGIAPALKLLAADCAQAADFAVSQYRERCERSPGFSDTRRGASEDRDL